MTNNQQKYKNSFRIFLKVAPKCDITTKNQFSLLLKGLFIVKNYPFEMKAFIQLSLAFDKVLFQIATVVFELTKESYGEQGTLFWYFSCFCFFFGGGG